MSYSPGFFAQWIHFDGTLANDNGAVARAFTVLAGDGAPTITGGFAKWGIIDRPKRAGLTVLQGYDPYVITIPVKFDAVATGRAPRPDGKTPTPSQNEDDIQVLEWMGGRGKLVDSSGVFTPARGDSPLINVQSVNGRGHQTSLIPRNAQDVDYVVSGLEYDSAPLRDVHGSRVRQDATVTLTQFVGAPGDRLLSAAKASFLRVRITSELRTIAHIMVSRAHNSDHRDWAKVVAVNKHRLRLNGSSHQDLVKAKLLGEIVLIPMELVRKTRKKR